jgi:hypothetical protein
MISPQEELVFAPLGGVGEIGMNLSLYGLGTERSKKWLAVDLGVAFAGDDLPGARPRGPFRCAPRPVAAAQGAGLRDAVHRGAP